MRAGAMLRASFTRTHPMSSSASLPATSTPPESAHSPARQGLAALTLGAIGVVYGDIGTSPLYTVKEVFAPHTGVPLDAAPPDRRGVGDLLGADAGGDAEVRAS